MCYARSHAMLVGYCLSWYKLLLAVHVWDVLTAAMSIQDWQI